MENEQGFLKRFAKEIAADFKKQPNMRDFDKLPATLKARLFSEHARHYAETTNAAAIANLLITHNVSFETNLSNGVVKGNRAGILTFAKKYGKGIDEECYHVLLVTIRSALTFDPQFGCQYATHFWRILFLVL